MNLITPCSSVSTSISSSIASLLRICKTIGNLEQVHVQIIHKGLEQDAYLITQFICLCNTLSSHVGYATSVFDRVLQPSSHIWNSIIKGYCMHSSLANTLSIFVRMNRSSTVPDTWTFPSLIKACSTELALREGQAIHGLALKYGTDADVFVGSSLIDFYGKCQEIKCACNIFNELPDKNVVSWTAMLFGYVNVGNLVEAKKLFDQMPNKNLACWNAMIQGFARFGDMSSARKLFDEMPKRDIVSFTTMIDGYAKSGDMIAARFLFDQSPELDIVSWTALITGYAQNGHPNEAVKVFLEMHSRNIKPDEYIIVSVMSACSQIGCLELAKWVDSYAKWVDSYAREQLIHRRGVHITTALIDMNAKCGNMERANKLFEEMPKRDLISYCSMIQGLSSHGRWDQAVSLFERMLSEGLTPDDVAFMVILSACSQAGLIKEGCHYFNSMIYDYSIVPSPNHYACMVDLLGRAGRLEAAYVLIKSMPVEPNAAAWGALLGACKMHCNLEIGEEVANRLFEIEHNNGGNYVALSNIYAEANRWLDVSLVRSKMDERGVRKIPGRSWI